MEQPPSVNTEQWQRAHEALLAKEKEAYEWWRPHDAYEVQR